MLEYENMEIAKISKENEKYMMLTAVGAKNRNWDSYEHMMAQERLVNRKMLHMMAEQGKDKLTKAGRNSTYRAYLSKNSNFASGEGMAPLFPRRHRSPKY